MKLRPPELDRANRQCSGLIEIPEFRLLIRAISELISAPDLSLLSRYYFGEVYPLCKEQRYDVHNLLEFELCPGQHHPKSALKVSDRVDGLCFRFCSMLRDSDPPEIEVEKSWVHSGEGYRAELVCLVHGEPDPTTFSKAEQNPTGKVIELSGDGSIVYCKPYHITPSADEGDSRNNRECDTRNYV
ncbi:unnamed protein product [Bemisia tabaci]|uniref:Uncharacterized protein n=1 Tax=Bemisia tabaci TaxID=7038 RepID=A0A9P0A035_BEMTA|nr:unnamed protein product [Bemisia tabaci]